MITKRTLSSTLSYELGLTTRESRDAVNILISTITNALAAGEEVYITKFARLTVVDKPSRVFRHSTTGELVRSVAGKRIRCKFQDGIMKRIDPSYPFRYGHSMEDLVEPEEDDDEEEWIEDETDWKEECGLESKASVVIDCDEIKTLSVEDYEELIERPENAELDEAG